MKLKILISSFLLVGISQATLLGRQGILAQTANKLGIGNIISVNADAEANLLGNKVGVDGAVGVGGQGIGAHLSGDADVLGQKVNVHGDVLEGHAIDQHNHEVFRDNTGRQYTLQRQYIGSNSVLVRKYLDNGQIYLDGANQNNVLQHSQSGSLVINGNSGSSGVVIIGGNQGQQGGLIINGGSGWPTTNIGVDTGLAGLLRNIKRVSPLEWQEWLLAQKQRNKYIDLTIIENWINQQHQLLKVDTAVIEGWIIQQQNLNPNFLYNWIINHQVPNILGNVRPPIDQGWNGQLRPPIASPEVWQQWVLQQRLKSNLDLTVVENWIYQQNKALNLNVDFLRGWVIQQQQLNPSFLYNWIVRKQVPNIFSGGISPPIFDPNTNIDTGFIPAPLRELLKLKKVSPLQWQEWLLDQKQRNKYIDITLIENWVNQQHQLLKVDIGIIEAWIIQQQNLNPSFLYNWIILKLVPNILGNTSDPAWDGQIRPPAKDQIWQQWLIQQIQKTNLDLTPIEYWINEQHKTLNLDIDFLRGWIMQQQLLNPSFLYNWIIKNQVPNISDGNEPIVPTKQQIWQQWLIQQRQKTNLDLTPIEYWINEQRKTWNLDVDFLREWIMQQQQLNPNFLYNWIIKNQVPNISNGREPIVPTKEQIWQQWLIQQRQKTNLDLTPIEYWINEQRKTWNLDVDFLREWIMQQQQLNPNFLYNWIIKNQVPNISNGKEPVVPTKEQIWQQWLIQQRQKTNLDLTPIEYWINEQRKTWNLDVDFLREWIMQQQQLNPNFLYNWIIKNQVPNISNGKEPVVPTKEQIWQQWLIQQRQKTNLDLTPIEYWINEQRKTWNLDVDFLREWIMQQQQLNPNFLYNWIIKNQVPNISNGKEPVVPTKEQIWQQWLIQQRQKTNLDLTPIEYWINEQRKTWNLDVDFLREWIMQQQQLNPNFLYNWIIKNQVPNISNGKEPVVPTKEQIWQQWLIQQRQKTNLDLTPIEYWINEQRKTWNLDVDFLREWIMQQQQLNPNFLYNWIIKNQVPNISNGKEPVVPTKEQIWQQWLIQQRQKTNLDLTPIEYWINEQRKTWNLDVDFLREWIMQQQQLNPNFLYNWIIKNQVPNISNGKEPVVPTKEQIWQQWLIQQRQKTNLDLTPIEYWINEQRKTWNLDVDFLREWIMQQQQLNPNFLYNWIIKNQVPNISNGKEPVVPTKEQIWQQWLIQQRQKTNLDLTPIEYWINEQRKTWNLDVDFLREWIMQQQQLNPNFLYNWIIKNQVPNISNGKEPVVPTKEQIWQQWLIQQRQKTNLDLTPIEYWINEQRKTWNLDVDFLREWIMQQQQLNPNFLYNWIIKNQVPNISNGKEPVVPTKEQIWQQWLIQQRQKTNLDLTPIEYWINEQRKTWNLDVDFLREWIMQQQQLNPNFLYNWIIKNQVPNISNGKEPVVPTKEQIWQQWLIQQRQKTNLDLTPIEYWINEQRKTWNLDVDFLREWIMQQQQLNPNFLYNWIIKNQVPNISNGKEPVVPTKEQIWQQWLIQQRQKTNLDLTPIEYWINEQRKTWNLDVDFLREWIMQQQQLNPNFLYNWIIKNQVPNISNGKEPVVPTKEQIWQQWLIQQRQKTNLDLTPIEYWINEQRKTWNLDVDFLREWIMQQQQLNPNFLYNWIIKNQVPNISNGKEPVVPTKEQIWQQWLIQQRQKTNLDLTPIEYWINEQRKTWNLDVDFLREWIMQQQQLNPNFLYNWIIKNQVPNISNGKEPVVPTKEQIWQQWLIQQRQKTNLDLTPIEYWINEQRKTWNLDVDFLREWIMQQQQLNPNFLYNWIIKNQVPNISNGKEPVVPTKEQIWQQWLIQQRQKTNLDLTPIEYWINEQRKTWNLDVDFLREWIMQQQQLNPNFLYNWIIKNQVPNISNGKEPVVPTKEQIWQQWLIQQRQKTNLDLTPIEYWINEQRKTWNLDVDFLREWIMQQQQLNPNFLYNWIIKNQVPNISNGKEPVVPTKEQIWQQWLIQQRQKTNLDLTPIEYWINEQRKTWNLDVDFLREWIMQQQQLNPNFLYNWIIKNQVPNISNGKEPVVPTKEQIWQQWLIQQRQKTNLDLTPIEYWINEQRKTWNLDVDFLREWIMQQQQLNPNFLYNWIIKNQVPNISSVR
uniref:Uncharacterized protein LOC114340321 n=1 Tax=Diabrotica virgifera virgifera TaxID=50390 RepID=A0A6P7GNV2_DIAVI